MAPQNKDYLPQSSIQLGVTRCDLVQGDAGWGKRKCAQFLGSDYLSFSPQFSSSLLPRLRNWSVHLDHEMETILRTAYKLDGAGGSGDTL